jgi:acyl-CoA synthetase (AMP-forming)/AMP-acid ligase II
VTAPVQLWSLLQRGLDAGRDRPAIRSLEGSWTWGELEDRTNRLAKNYLALGLEPGDRIASLMPNRVALLAHYLACFKARLVVTPLTYRYMPPEIDHALDVSGARIILAHAERASNIAASKASHLPLGVISYGAGEGSDRSFEQLMQADSPAIALPDPDPARPHRQKRCEAISHPVLLKEYPGLKDIPVMAYCRLHRLRVVRRRSLECFGDVVESVAAMRSWFSARPTSFDPLKPVAGNDPADHPKAQGESTRHEGRNAINAHHRAKSRPAANSNTLNSPTQPQAYHPRIMRQGCGLRNASV